MADGQQTEERRGREGGRWINERPDSEEFARWFKESMKLEEGMDIDRYIGGVVLIPAVDNKARHVTGFQNGKPIIEERPELSFVPYAKVEARIAYFWDLLEKKDEWVGVVERVSTERPPLDPILDAIEAIASAEGASPELAREIAGVLAGRGDYKPGALTSMAAQLPEGFSVMSVPVGNAFSHFLCCTIRVAIYDKTEWEAKGAQAVPLREGQGTKQVPLSKSYNSRSWADEASLMKAETGALGRALGFAGIFVIPGSGVATAEDMAEMSETGAASTSEQSDAQGPAAPTEPPVRAGAEQTQDDETALRQRAGELLKELREDFPEIANGEFATWAKERQIRGLGEAKGAMLKGVVKKLEKLLDEAKQRQEGASVPSETGSEDGGAGGDHPDGPREEDAVADESKAEGEASDGESG